MKSKHRLNRMELREERAAYGFLFISLIGTVTFILVPIIMSMFLGFTTWNPMKGLAGGLIHNSNAAMAYISQYDNVLPS